MSNSEYPLLDRFRSLRSSLGWILLAQLATILFFWALIAWGHFFSFKQDESQDGNLPVGFILLVSIAVMIGTTVFCGGRLMKIIITKQEIEGKNVTLNNLPGLYAFFLVFFPLLAIIGAPTKGGPLFSVPVLFIPIYATIPLVVIYRRLNRFLEKQNSNQND